MPVRTTNRALRRRLLNTAAAAGVLTLSLAGVLANPLTVPGAVADNDVLEVALGDTSVELKNVDALHNPSRSCMHYYGSGSQTSTSTGIVYGSSGQYAAVSYGMPQPDRCPDSYGTDPMAVPQTSMSLKPSSTTKVNAGDPFLLGVMRHNNRPIYTGTSGKNGVYEGSFRIRTAGTIDSDFPWREEDTLNDCTGRLDREGHLIIGDYGGSVDERDERVPTEYAFDRNGRVGRAGGSYVYDANGNELYESNGRYYFYSASSDGNRVEAGDMRDAWGQACSDDFLTIRSDRSQTTWKDPKTQIDYRLKIWGFTFNGTQEQCPADPGDRHLNEFFVTPEHATSYGCIYGSIEQLRPITFQVDTNADESVRQTLGNPPAFSYSNTSAPGSYGAQHWGNSIGTLTPTGWGEPGRSGKTSPRTLLAPNDLAAVTQDAQPKQATVAPDGTITRSGWYLKGIDCLYTLDPDNALMLNAKNGGGRLDRSNNVNLGDRSLRLDQSQLAVDYKQAAVTCTWHNEYVLATSNLTLTNVVDSGGADPSQWTLSATPKDTGLYGQKTITGASGTPATTSQPTAAGTYVLDSSNGPEGYTRNGQWSCTGATVRQDNGVTYAVLDEGANAQCTIHHKSQTTAVTASKTVTGASDAAKPSHYELSYSCVPAGGGAPATGTVQAQANGAPVAIDGLKGGSSCQITEQKLDASSLSTPASGAFSWGAPDIDVSVTKGGTTTPVTTTPVAQGPSNGPGVAFTLPDSTQGEVSIAVTNTVVAHAGVTKTFDSVAKSAQQVGGRDTFDQTYTVTVTNPSAAEDLTYSLTDTTQAPTGTTINSVTVTRQDGTAIAVPAGATTWQADQVDLAGGGQHTYTVVANVSAPDAGLTLAAGETCDADAVANGKAVLNTASLTTEGDKDAVQANACGTVPANPRFSVSKTAGEVTRNLDGSGFTATYQVTVTNTSHVGSKIIADVRDQLGLPASTKVSKVEVHEGGQVVKTLTGAALEAPGGMVLAAAGSGEELAPAPQGQGAGGTRTLGVHVVFTVDPAVAGYQDSDYQCGATRADGKPAGLVNTVVMDGDTDGAANDTTCLSTSSALRFSKTVETRPGAGSTFDVAYTITAQNQGSLPGDTGEVLDRPGFAPGLVINRLTVAKDGGPAQEVAPDNGSYRLTSGETVASGQTITWRVAANVSVDPGATGYSDQALACQADAGSGELQPGHGLFNQVVTAAGKDLETSVNHERACADVSSDAGRRGFTVVKTGSQGALDGAAFELYPTDPSAAGAAPVPGAVTPTGDKGTFNVAPQLINREYWLVETEAPAGHTLLANPVHVKVTDKGLMVLNGNQLGVSTARASAVADPAVADTLTIVDIEAARLPLSGGSGFLPSLAVAAPLLLAGGLLGARNLRRALRTS